LNFSFSITFMEQNLNLSFRHEFDKLLSLLFFYTVKTVYSFQ
jgi:hypothetical protein